MTDRDGNSAGPGPVVRALEPTLPSVLGDRISLQVDVAADTGSVGASPDELEKVILNLVENGRDAIGGGDGTVAVTVANAELGKEEAADLGAPAGPYVEIRVRDTGQGIPPDDRDRIFEPFFTTRGMDERAGLGLATVDRIVRRCDGVVAVESAPGRGSTFRVLLPRLDDPDPAETSGRPPADGRNGTILVVEDEQAVLRLVTRVLERRGHTVLPADRPSEALDRARSHAAGIDLVVTDVVMPEMHGTRLAEALAPLLPAAPVLFVSGYARDELPALDGAGRPSAFLAKPFTPDELVKAVDGLLAGAGDAGS